MKTDWDYTHLARAYLARPPYSEEVIDEILRRTSLADGSRICDVGAGVAHLTLPLVKRGYVVTAVEPNDAMRALGAERTASFANVAWVEGTGEDTGQPDDSFDLVTFGSSFNVCDRSRALLETSRILKAGGWFVCMWNHRDLEDPIQAHLEAILQRVIRDYSYGTRREDQTDIINSSGLFGQVVRAKGVIRHEQSIGDCLEAWRSHATVKRQAGENFERIISEIEEYLQGLNTPSITIPYMTQAWYAKVR